VVVVGAGGLVVGVVVGGVAVVGVVVAGGVVVFVAPVVGVVVAGVFAVAGVFTVVGVVVLLDPVELAPEPAGLGDDPVDEPVDGAEETTDDLPLASTANQSPSTP
jgi:hypothetical protein